MSLITCSPNTGEYCHSWLPDPSTSFSVCMIPPENRCEAAGFLLTSKDWLSDADSSWIILWCHHQMLLWHDRTTLSPSAFWISWLNIFLEHLIIMIAKITLAGIMVETVINVIVLLISLVIQSLPNDFLLKVFFHTFLHFLHSVARLIGPDEMRSQRDQHPVSVWSSEITFRHNSAILPG